MGDFIAPLYSLAIAFGERGEMPARKERIAHIANGSFHTPFLIAPAHLARLWSEVIMGAQLDQPGVEEDVIAAALQARRS